MAIARRSDCPKKLGSRPGRSRPISSQWHGCPGHRDARTGWLWGLPTDQEPTGNARHPCTPGKRVRKTAEMASSVGADGFPDKPFLPGDLLGQVGSLLGRRMANRRNSKLNEESLGASAISASRNAMPASVSFSNREQVSVIQRSSHWLVPCINQSVAARPPGMGSVLPTGEK